jgi:uncharacterized membrane protein
MEAIHQAVGVAAVACEFFQDVAVIAAQVALHQFLDAASLYTGVIQHLTQQLPGRTQMRRAAVKRKLLEY